MQEMQKVQAWSVAKEDPLQEGMATHTSILAWKIPWTEEPGGLQSIGWAESDTMEATEYLYFNGSQNTSKVNVLKQ